MLTFAYTAKTENGQLATGEMQAVDANAAAQTIMAKGFYPIKIEQKKSSSGILELNIFQGVSTKAKAELMNQFSTLISAGLPVAQAFSVLIQQIDNPYLKKVFLNILNDIQNGSSLSSAFSKYPKIFTVTDISLIESGEASGALDTVLKRMARQLEKDKALKSKVRGAMIYPSFVIAVVIGVIAVMLMSVMPKLADLYAGFKGKLPFITQLMLNISDILIHYWWVMVFGIIMLAVFARSFINTPYGRYFWDQAKLSIPGIGALIQKIILARFTRTLGTLMGAGVPVLDALSISSKACGNVIYEIEVKKVAQTVRGGAALSDPLKKNPLFPPVVGQMINVGEQTGEMDQMLEGLANYYEDEVDNIIKGLSSLMEPIIIVVLGVVVGGILVAIMLPIYSLSQVMFKQ